MAPELSGQDGLLGFAFRQQLLGRQVWTLSVWSDRAALGRFLAASLHRDAVEEGSIPRESLESLTLELAAGELPLDWRRVEVLLAERRDGPGP